MKYLLIALLLLSGCAEWQAIIAERGAQASAATLKAAEWAECTAATAGALETKYQLYTNPNGPKAKAWRELCYGNDEEIEE